MLPRENRIASGAEIKQITKEKQLHLTSSLFYLAAKRNQKDQSRLAIICSKKIGKAVTRNRLRRQYQAIFIKNMAKNGPHIDFVIIIRKNGIDEERITRAIKNIYENS